MSSLRLPISLSVIFGSFTLGLYIAIQGPTLMDLIDILHVNNDIMSYTLAFSSLAYSFGGLMSGFLFNYVNRQTLIIFYFAVFGTANIVTPYISNYYIFSVITVFKMMCAGGTDCGANVWILEMWPGQDAWLQALHFSFAVGCALGPLIVEPFLAAEQPKESEISSFLNLFNTAQVSDQNNETRIYIPYGVSGAISILASIILCVLYNMDERRKKQAALQAKHHQPTNPEHQQTTAALMPPATSTLIKSEHIPLAFISHPEPLAPPPQTTPNSVPAPGQSPAPAPSPLTQQGNTTPSPRQHTHAGQQLQQSSPLLSNSPKLTPAAQAKQQPQQHHQQHVDQHQQAVAIANKVAPPSPAASAKRGPVETLTEAQQQQQQTQTQTQIQIQAQTAQDVQRITSRANSQIVGRPPYYVMFAILLAAMCLSFYCGIEITSMNYLATFAVNIDLQLPKSTAALMSSALTISFAVGRAFGIVIAAYMKPHKLFYFCSCIMAAGNVFMLIFANTAETLLWYSICLFGIGCGPMFPAIVSFYDDKISKVTNTVSGIFILGSMFNVALNSLIIGHYIIDNALILIVCNLVGSVLLLFLFGTLHMLTRVKKNQRRRKYIMKQRAIDVERAQCQALLPLVGPDSSGDGDNENQLAGADKSAEAVASEDQRAPESPSSSAASHSQLSPSLRAEQPPPPPLTPGHPVAGDDHHGDKSSPSSSHQQQPHSSIVVTMPPSGEAPTASDQPSFASSSSSPPPMSPHQPAPPQQPSSSSLSSMTPAHQPELQQMPQAQQAAQASA